MKILRFSKGLYYRYSKRKYVLRARQANKAALEVVETVVGNETQLKKCAIIALNIKTIAYLILPKYH